MAMLQSVGIFKVIGIFGFVIMLILWFAGSGIQFYNSVREGDYKGALASTGGKIFAIDTSMHEEADYLLTTDEPVHQRMFHFTYAISLLFILFTVAFFIFKGLNWAIGIKQFSAWSDILIIALIALVFLMLQFFYGLYVLDKAIIPFKDGIWYFVKNLPDIFGRMIN